MHQTRQAHDSLVWPCPIPFWTYEICQKLSTSAAVDADYWSGNTIVTITCSSGCFFGIAAEECVLAHWDGKHGDVRPSRWWLHLTTVSSIRLSRELVNVREACKFWSQTPQCVHRNDVNICRLFGSWKLVSFLPMKLFLILLNIKVGASVTKYDSFGSPLPSCIIWSVLYEVDRWFLCASSHPCVAASIKDSRTMHECCRRGNWLCKRKLPMTTLKDAPGNSAAGSFPSQSTQGRIVSFEGVEILKP